MQPIEPNHEPRGAVETAATTRRRRWRDALVAGGIAMLAAAYVLVRGTSDPTASDFDQLWHAARALMIGADPYEYVGPNGVFVWDHLFYPLPAVLMVSPLALLPLLAARACFAAISAGLLAAVFLRDNPARLLLLTSAPFLVAIGRGQFSPLIVATAYLPLLAWVGIAKPNIGAAVWFGSQHPRRSLKAGIIGGGILVLASFLIYPGWLAAWLEMLYRKGGSTSMPILGQGGFVIALAFLRWRRPEAKLLVSLGVIPQTPGLYDTVPLFLVPRGFRECCILSLAGNVALLFLVAGPGLTTGEIGPLYAQRAMLWSSLCMYLPCVLMILCRPNAPGLLEGTPYRGNRIDVAMLVALFLSGFFAGWATLSRFL